jgi:lipid A 3-O-deacylase
MKRLLVLLLLVGVTSSLLAQRISNTALYRDVLSQKYFRIYYENDYFSETDIYYTQGINLEYVHPSIGNFFTSKLLVRSAGKEMKYGLSLEHEGYTPTSISHSEILRGDRPFAAALFFKTFSIASDAVRKERISSSLSAGVIGPVAGGKEIQETIHRWINYTLPQGWQNQIGNDVILNYQVDYERGLFSVQDYFLLSGKASVRAGTFNTRASVGTILMLGRFDDPFSNFLKQKTKWQVFVYAEPLVNLIGHDATLQGGLLNATSAYTIASTQINRWVFQGNAGIVFRVKNIQLEYFQSYLTKEFETGGSHHWGGIRVGWFKN